MSGFLGFFNYDKEGPGVPKDGPQKKTFVVFLEMYFRNFWKFLTINAVYSLLSILVIPNGLANVGLTNIVRNTARNKHSFGLTDFFETIKKNLKQSLIAGIINAVLFALLIFDILFFRDLTIIDGKEIIGVVGTGIAMALYVTFSLMSYYLWTLIITFSFSLKQAYSISFKLAFINFKYSFLILFINILYFAANIGLCFIAGKSLVLILLFELIIYFFVYPAFNGLLIQFCTFPCIKKFIIDPYYKQHPNADIEKRRNLGLEIEDVKAPEETEQQSTQEVEDEDDEDADDSIFTD